MAPAYGETPIYDDEFDALQPSVRDLLGDPIMKAAVYDLEQAVQAESAEELLTRVLDAALPVEDLMTDHLLRELHRRLYGDIWTWGGALRRREVNIGVAPEQIAVELRTSIETIRFRWQHTDDWTARQLGIALRAETVRIHPFVDGNGRSSRLLADLVFAAAQNGDTPELYDWRLEKRRYIDLLPEYDRHRDPTALAEFIGTEPIG